MWDRENLSETIAHYDVCVEKISDSQDMPFTRYGRIRTPVGQIAPYRTLCVSVMENRGSIFLEPACVIIRKTLPLQYIF